MPSSSSMKSWTRTSSGWPLGCHSRPPFLKVADQFLLLGVHRDHRLAALLEAIDHRVDVLELGIAIRMRSAFLGLAIALQAVPALLEHRPDRPAPTGCPAPVSVCARFVVLLHVQRSGDIGSPRVLGSINRSSACTNPGSVSVSRLRPPPSLRSRAATGARGCFLRTASSTSPLRMVLRDIPVALLTALTPPRPKVCASVAAHCRRMRSSISGASAR